MKFKITDTKYERIDTEREIEIEFPFYYRIEDEEYYYDYRGAEMDARSVTYGVIHKSVLGREVCVSIWQITTTNDGRQSFDDSWKVDHNSYAPLSIISENMLRGKITQEEFEEGKNDAIDTMTKMTIYNQ